MASEVGRQTMHKQTECMGLHDKNKHDIIVRYTQVYDNEWTDAYIELTEEYGLEERQAIQLLLNILTNSFQHYKTLALQRVKDEHDFERELRRESKLLEKSLQQLLPGDGQTPQTQLYICAIADLCRLLNQQDPPYSLRWEFGKGDPFDTSIFDEYMIIGKFIDYVVWPVLYLEEGGAVLCMGVAQAIDEKGRQEESSNNSQGVNKSTAAISIDPDKKLLYSSEGAGGFDLSEDPDYVDLSDENRPTKMPERYNRLYDNEWTEAFCELTNVHGMVEQHAIHVLLDILMISFEYCHERATQQLDEAKRILGEFNVFLDDSRDGKQLMKRLKIQRKLYYKRNLPEIKTGLENKIKHLFTTFKPGAGMESYMAAVLDLCWLLNVQDPQCFISCGLLRGDKFDGNLYRQYMSTGNLIDYIVWPTLHLFKGGNILCKGVAQAMPAKEETVQDYMKSTNIDVLSQTENKFQRVKDINIDSRRLDELDSIQEGADTESPITFTSEIDDRSMIDADKKLLAIESQIIPSVAFSELKTTYFSSTVPAPAHCKKKDFGMSHSDKTASTLVKHT